MTRVLQPWAAARGHRDGDDDAALLDDLFTLFDEPPSPVVESDDATSVESASPHNSVARPPTPPLVPMAPRKQRTNARSGDPVKRTLDALRAEAHQLTEELLRLRQQGAESQGSLMETALTERYKRRRAEDECQQLRDAVYAQTKFIRGLRSVFSAPPSVASGLNLCRHMHNYTKLPRDRSTRWNEYAALAQETRLRRAVDILCRETESLTCEDGYKVVSPAVAEPFIETELINTPEGFGVTTTSVYAVDTCDMGMVLRGACVAVRDILAKCQSYRCTSMRKEIVDPEVSSSASSNILYRVMGIHHKSFRDSDELSIESRFITLYKEMDNDSAVVLWDYIDDDELHPTNATTDITRQAVGALLVRRELCDDGVERVVCRGMNTRQYRFHERGPKDTLMRFRNTTASSMRQNELLFRGLVLESMENEQAAYTRAASRPSGA